MSVAGSGERLLERRRLLPAGHQLQDVPATELDGNDRQEKDARGRLARGGEDESRFHSDRLLGELVGGSAG